MTRFFRRFTRANGDSDLLPVALLLLAVLVPALCLLWFMSAAMRNERFAARQKLAEIYRAQLSISQARLERHWEETAAELEKLAETAPAPIAFARSIQSGRVDSVVVFDGQGRILYPNKPTAPKPDSVELEPKWAEANRLEYLKRDFITAAGRYEALAKETTNVNSAARALQSQARCLVQAGRVDATIHLVDQVLSDPRYVRAIDSQGRLVVANAELLALELLTNNTATTFQSVAQRLRQRLLDYENQALAATQRRFLMKELQRLSPQLDFPTLNAEELAAGAIERLSQTSPAAFSNGLAGAQPISSQQGLHRSALPDVWQFTTPKRRALALVRTEKWIAHLRPILSADNLPADAEITLLPPDADQSAAFVTRPVGECLPGWQLALILKNPEFFDATTQHRTAIYFWTGVLVIGAMGILTLTAIRVVRRQGALARLKNNLAATVSHELKTPLSSMRVLVDTLLDSKSIEEQKTREYLRLIAQENERLSRVIQNFLTFSRMERSKGTFDIAAVPTQQIIDAVISAVRDRFAAPACQFETEIAENLPDVMAAPDAMATALINLLDNAYKYSEGKKRIVFRVWAEREKIFFSVQDNGIGIAPRETKRIFQPFHQIDSRLSRHGGGCGLGLCIVHNIVREHGGEVAVESAPGCGSTFTISLPVVAVENVNENVVLA